MNTIVPQENKMRSPVRGRRRTRTTPLQSEPIDELVEMDLDYAETLLDDLAVRRDAESDVMEVAAHHDTEEDAPAQHHAADEETPRPPVRAEHNGGGSQEMADVWTARSGKAPLLTPAQEIVLAKRVERGDRKAREELMNANVRLVASVARRYMGRGLPLEDLMQEGLIGLLRAIEKYNYRKGYRFSTYATHWIRQSVSRSLANQGRSIRLPAHVVDSIGRIARVREELFQKLGRLPTRQEVAEAAGMTEKKLVHLLRSAVQPVSLEQPIGEEGESRLGELIPAGSESSPSERVFQHLVRDEIEHALNSLMPREKEVLILRYGLGDEEPHTLEETGRRLHITRERARQIEGKALEKLRHLQTSGRLSEVVH